VAEIPVKQGLFTHELERQPWRGVEYGRPNSALGSLFTPTLRDPGSLMNQRPDSSGETQTANDSQSSSRESQKRRPGRPPTHAESWTKVTVVLFDRQIAYLDGVVQTIRARSGATISRAQLIRALVDAAHDAQIDLSAGGSEAELRAALAARLAASKDEFNG
jgi:hypothetical protein